MSNSVWQGSAYGTFVELYTLLLVAVIKFVYRKPLHSYAAGGKQEKGKGNKSELASVSVCAVQIIYLLKIHEARGQGLLGRRQLQYERMLAPCGFPTAPTVVCDHLHLSGSGMSSLFSQLFWDVYPVGAMVWLLLQSYASPEGAALYQSTRAVLENVSLLPGYFTVKNSLYVDVTFSFLCTKHSKRNPYLSLTFPLL